MRWTCLEVTCAISNLEHPLAVGDAERLNTKVSDCVFARIGNQIVRSADPIIEPPRLFRAVCPPAIALVRCDTPPDRACDYSNGVAALAAGRFRMNCMMCG